VSERFALADALVLPEGWAHRDYERRYPARRRSAPLWALCFLLHGTLYTDEKLAVLTRQIREAVARHIGVEPIESQEPKPRGPVAPMRALLEVPWADERQYILSLNETERRQLESELESRLVRMELYAADDLRTFRAILAGAADDVELEPSAQVEPFWHCGARVRFAGLLPYCPKCGNTGSALAPAQESRAA
jgi:hypothetical protein